MIEARKARAVGFNHVALEVGDIEEALAFYGRLFDFELRPCPKPPHGFYSDNSEAASVVRIAGSHRASATDAF